MAKNPVREPIIDVFEHIIDSQNRTRWSSLKEAGDVFVLNQQLAAPLELKYYKFRMLAHKHGLNEDEFARDLKRGLFPEHADLRASVSVPSRAERAKMTPFPALEELAASRFARFGPDQVPKQVLLHRLDSCGLSRAGSTQHQWLRLKEHVYEQTPTAFFQFCLQRVGRPKSELELLSKRELFNLWNQVQDSDATESLMLLDAWHHSADYSVEHSDVSDMALQSDQFSSLVEEHVLAEPDQFNDTSLTRGFKFALRPEYLRAVTNFYGFDTSADTDYKTLLNAAHTLSHSTRAHNNDNIEHLSANLTPHWPTVIKKCQAQDLSGALLSAGYFEPHVDSGVNIATLKRTLRRAQSSEHIMPVQDFDSFLNSF